ncbi:MAG: PIN domain-containing protein [Kineosporiaceae bacterium]
MTSLARGPVVVDTGVFGANLLPRHGPLASGYRPLLTGRQAIVSFVTVAELRFGARRAGWGEARMARLVAQVGRAHVVWAHTDLTDVYADLRAWCVAHGHALGHKPHEADRWVAATALYAGVPLVAHDAVFRGVKGLDLLTRL